MHITLYVGTSFRCQLVRLASSQCLEELLTNDETWSNFHLLRTISTHHTGDLGSLIAKECLYSAARSAEQVDCTFYVTPSWYTERFRNVALVLHGDQMENMKLVFKSGSNSFWFLNWNTPLVGYILCCVLEPLFVNWSNSFTTFEASPEAFSRVTYLILTACNWPTTTGADAQPF